MPSSKPPENQNSCQNGKVLTRHKSSTRPGRGIIVPKDDVRFGWKRGGAYEDISTYKYVNEDAFILDSVDLRNTIFTDTQGAKVSFPDVSSQGKLYSCSAIALAFCYQFDMLKNKASFGPNKTSDPSILFIYYYARKFENTINSNTGVNISTGVQQVLEIKGVCSETDWPYNGSDTSIPPNVAKYLEEPNALAISNALTHKVTKETNYQALGKLLNNYKLNLQKGFPVVFGFNVYSSFLKISKSNPVMPIPTQNETLLGQHAVTMVGFKEKEQVFIMRNCWGSRWADNGYFYMPYSYVDSNECSDFWSITDETN